MNTYTIYLNLDTNYSSSYITIVSESIQQTSDREVCINGTVLVNFNNEILGISSS